MTQQMSHGCRAWLAGEVRNVSLRIGHRPAERQRFSLSGSPICRRCSANLGRRRCRRRQKPDEVHWASSLIVELRLRQVIFALGRS